MKYCFTALRFIADKNLQDKLYWYLCPFSVKEGEKVLAPVGVHDRLQCAEVERVLYADEREAPYDMRLIKRVEAKYGARLLVVDGVSVLEFGGVRYDDRHYTPFARLLFTKRRPADMSEICAYGVTKVLDADEKFLYEEIAESIGGVLIAGDGAREVMKELNNLCRGEECKIPRELWAPLKEKLL